MDEKIVSVLAVIEKLESRINSYWNFYTIVVLASVGWLMSAETSFSPQLNFTLTTALVVFFLANFAVMWAATKRVVAFENELNILSTKTEFISTSLRQELSNASMPFRLLSSTLLHLAVDIAIISFIWVK